MSNKILFFSSESCGPCSSVKKQLNEDICKELNIVMLDAEKDVENFINYQVMGVPTFVKLVDGKETNRKSGYRTIQELKNL